jgi:hypothetical protein
MMFFTNHLKKWAAVYCLYVTFLGIYIPFVQALHTVGLKPPPRPYRSVLDSLDSPNPRPHH